MQKDINIALENYAKESPCVQALIGSGVALSYSELDNAIRCGAYQLRLWGVGPGDRVALIFSDEVLLAIALLAVWRLGATAMVIPRSSSPAQCADWTARADVSQCVTDLEVVHICSLPIFRFDEFWLDGCLNSIFSDCLPIMREDRSKENLLIVVGSGSTGRPKLIPITHAQMSARAEALSLTLAVTARDRLATMTHLEYAGPQHRLYLALIMGATFVVPDRRFSELSQLREKFGITILTSAVMHVEQMLKFTKLGAPRPLDGLTLTLSSSTVSHRLRRDIIDRICGNLRIVYGANESWTASITDLGGALDYEGTVGRIAPGVEIAIVDKNMQPVSIGGVGLIRIKSDQVIDGYICDDVLTRQHFQDGWFMPGDLGRIAEGGQLIFCGRADNMMIFNGINVYPAEIERTLQRHPSIREALAFPIKHQIAQEIPACAVVLKPGVYTTQTELLTFARQRLGARSPHVIAILDAIPRNEQGKPQRAELFRLVEAALTKRVKPLAALNDRTESQ